MQAPPTQQNQLVHEMSPNVAPYVFTLPDHVSKKPTIETGSSQHFEIQAMPGPFMSFSGVMWRGNSHKPIWNIAVISKCDQRDLTTHSSHLHLWRKTWLPFNCRTPTMMLASPQLTKALVTTVTTIMMASFSISRAQWCRPTWSQQKNFSVIP